jgi:hypothetical protein
LEVSRAGNNGDALWAALQMKAWLAGMPASPVLDQLRNDVALLLASDLADVLAVLPIPSTTSPGRIEDEKEQYTFLDCVLGLWAFSSELVRSVEALAAATLPEQAEFVSAGKMDADENGPLLR